MNIMDKYKGLIQGLYPNGNSSIDLLLNILDSMSVGILIINLDCTVVYINQRYSQITGVKYDEIVGRRLRDVRFGARLPEVLETGQYINNVPRREGNKKYFVDLSPIYIEGKLIGALSIMKDIEEVRTISKELAFFQDELTKMKTVLSDTYKAKFTFKDIIGDSPVMIAAKQLALKASQSDGCVLISGNTGTGKEMFTQAIHNNSRRKNGPFVAINCASIPLNFIESELFGYEDGAFTGAKKGGKLGLIEIANGGTLFLDEIENMDLNLQSKLLRVLQEKKIRHIGGVAEINVNARIIAATNMDIDTLIEENKFREDLYYRLCVFPIYLPSLDERKKDIPELVDYFVKMIEHKYGHYIKVDPQVYDVMINYSWKGNVRELYNAIAYSVDVTDDFIIKVEDLPQRIRKGYSVNIDRERTLKEAAEAAEKALIKQYLQKYGDSVEAKKIVAKKLGISIATLYNKLRDEDEKS